MNKNLNDAKQKKENYAYYTPYNVVEDEMNAYVAHNPNVFRDKTLCLPCNDHERSNFTKFFIDRFEEYGIKKLIAISYAPAYNETNEPLSLFITSNKNFDKEKETKHGKVFTLTRETYENKKLVGGINYKNLTFEYLEGDGDFNSEEVTKFRDEADFIITNPPFPKLKEFVDWINQGENLSFIIIGNLHSLTYSNVKSLIENNKLWIGRTFPKDFIKPDGNIKKYGYIYWLTNVEYKKNYESLVYISKKNCIKMLKSETNKKYMYMYKKYDNYDAIEVSESNYIPSDYYGKMGVPVNFMKKYNPEEFEIIEFRNNGLLITVNDNTKSMYSRIIIRRIPQIQKLQLKAA